MNYILIFLLKKIYWFGKHFWFNDLNLPSTLAQERWWYNLFFSLLKKGLISLRVQKLSTRFPISKVGHFTLSQLLYLKETRLGQTWYWQAYTSNGSQRTEFSGTYLTSLGTKAIHRDHPVSLTQWLQFLFWSSIHKTS